MTQKGADKPPGAGAPPPLPNKASVSGSASNPAPGVTTTTPGTALPLPDELPDRPAEDDGRNHTLMYGNDELPEGASVNPQQAVPAPDLFIEKATEKTQTAPKRKASNRETIRDASLELPPAHPSDDEKPTVMTTMEDLETKTIDDEGSAYIGKLIDERYMVKSLIGRGGMGAVYHVEQIHLRKEMAIKLLHENLVARKQLISRFTREARAISRLSSPHTVMVYDFGRWGELFYLVMELLEGEPLDSILTRQGPVSAERTTRVLLQMCDSLKEAHAHGIVHRDLKPENVMVLHDGPHPDFIKILDFGLAKVEDVDDPYTIHSQKDIFGTPFYMSPEQIRAADVDGRSDVYAVGALAFKMLTGKQVFGHEKTTFDVLKAHLMNPAPRMKDVVDEGVEIHQALEDIVAKCLAKHPEERFQDMGELHAALVEARKSDFAKSGLSEEERRQIEQRREGGPGADVILPARLVSRETEALLADEELLGRHVRRGRAAKGAQFIAVVLILMGAIAAAMWGLGSEGVGQEAEPNDMPSQANQLDESGTTKGSIGERRSQFVGDRDCYRLPATTRDDDLAVRVKGVPTMDLQVSVHDKDGVTLLDTSHRASGDGELLAHIDTKRAPAVACVTEKKVLNQVAGESLSDVYTLTATVTAREGIVEREPNDSAGSDELPQGRVLRATIDGPYDRDVFALQDQFAGRVVRVRVESADNNDLAGLQVVMVDTAGRPLSARGVKDSQHKAELAFAASSRQMPDRLVVRPSETAIGMWKQLGRESYEYKVWYELTDVGDEGEKEPNNAAASAQDMVLGLWHIGAANDTAGVDWMRIDAGDKAMKRLHLEISATPGSGFMLTIRDTGARADLRRLKVLAGKDEDLYIDGSGAGFLVKIERLEGANNPRAKIGAKYRLRARWSFTGPPPAIP